MRDNLVVITSCVNDLSQLDLKRLIYNIWENMLLYKIIDSCFIFGEVTMSNTNGINVVLFNTIYTLNAGKKSNTMKFKTI